MAFLLRNISLSADGREIVRTSRVRDDLLKVGRDPDCDIRLTDLAVALHHATLEQISSTSRSASRPRPGSPSRSTASPPSSARSTPPPAATVRVGPFVLRILAVGDGLGRRRDRRRARRRRRRTRRSSTPAASRLATVLPGKRAVAWVAGGRRARRVPRLADLGLTTSQRNAEPEQIAAGFHADRLWSSGPLSRGHASLEQQLHRLPRPAVRVGARRILQVACHTQVHDHADLGRLQQARAASSASAAAFQLARRRRPFGQDAGPLRRLPYRA